MEGQKLSAGVTPKDLTHMCSDPDPITSVCLVGRGQFTQGRFIQHSAQGNLESSLEWDRILTAGSAVPAAEGSTQCPRAPVPHSVHQTLAQSREGRPQDPSAEQQTCLVRFESLLHNGGISGRIRLWTALSNTLLGRTSE